MYGSFEQSTNSKRTIYNTTRKRVLFGVETEVPHSDFDKGNSNAFKNAVFVEVFLVFPGANIQGPTADIQLSISLKAGPRPRPNRERIRSIWA